MSGKESDFFNEEESPELAAGQEAQSAPEKMSSGADDLSRSKAPDSDGAAAAEAAANSAQPDNEQQSQTSSPEPALQETREYGGSRISGSSQYSAKLKEALTQYLQISMKLLLSPRVFFNEMTVGDGFAHAGSFLALSAGGHALLSAIFNQFKLFSIPGRFAFDIVSTMVLASVAYIIGKGMGSKCSFEAVFKIFAYTGCLHVLAAVPGMQFITPVYSLVLIYLGLRKFVDLSTYKTALLLVLLTFMSAVLNLGRMFGAY